MGDTDLKPILFLTLVITSFTSFGTQNTPEVDTWKAVRSDLLYYSVTKTKSASYLTESTCDPNKPIGNSSSCTGSPRHIHEGYVWTRMKRDISDRKGVVTKEILAHETKIKDENKDIKVLDQQIAGLDSQIASATKQKASQEGSLSKTKKRLNVAQQTLTKAQTQLKQIVKLLKDDPNDKALLNEKAYIEVTITKQKHEIELSERLIKRYQDAIAKTQTNLDSLNQTLAATKTKRKTLFDSLVVNSPALAKLRAEDKYLAGLPGQLDEIRSMIARKDVIFHVAAQNGIKDGFEYMTKFYHRRFAPLAKASLSGGCNVDYVRYKKLLGGISVGGGKLNYKGGSNFRKDCRFSKVNDRSLLAKLRFRFHTGKITTKDIFIQASTGSRTQEVRVNTINRYGNFAFGTSDSKACSIRKKTASCRWKRNGSKYFSGKTQSIRVEWALSWYLNTTIR